MTFLPQTTTLSLSCESFQTSVTDSGSAQHHLPVASLPTAALSICYRRLPLFFLITLLTVCSIHCQWVSDCCPGFSLVGIKLVQGTHHHCGCPHPSALNLLLIANGCFEGYPKRRMGMSTLGALTFQNDGIISRHLSGGTTSFIFNIKSPHREKHILQMLDYRLT